MKFHGFPVGMTERLQENRLKNSREWYNAQKEQFKKEIYEPFYALIEDMTEPMLAIDPRMCLVPRTCVSRIVRDTRRTKDKTTLYRDNLWCFFRRSPKTEPNAPAFYFEFFPDRFRYGMYFGPWDRWAQDAYRATVLRNPDGLRQALARIRTMTPELECYRKKYRGAAPADLDDYYAAKSIHVGYTENGIAPLFDGSFVPSMRAAFDECADLYRFLADGAVPEEPEETPSEFLTDLPQNNNQFEW